MKLSVDRMQSRTHKENQLYIYAVTSSKLAIIIQNRDCPCAILCKQ